MRRCGGSSIIGHSLEEVHQTTLEPNPTHGAAAASQSQSSYSPSVPKHESCPCLELFRRLDYQFRYSGCAQFPAGRAALVVSGTFGSGDTVLAVLLSDFVAFRV